ncbi:hypothetical protein I0Q91_07405 [Halanaerobiaceae bacterium Z-7014]|uniref:DUF2953 domain-containing protein n=1 Tax=Halonatronomonas betaini TaxID=2778430 RepID=A0A931AQ66_9FIRM|nr:hypothetical protein [Halonatronomonas betaini]MBF8436897.1 hypothetical protein [Halonatronomonas betaini]
MFNTILMILVILLILLVMVLIAPISYRIKFNYSEVEKFYCIKLYFLGIKVYAIDSKSDKTDVDKSKDKVETQEKVEAKEELKKESKFSSFITFIRENNVTEYIGETWVLIRSILSQVLPKDYNINFKVGFEDPYYTGNLAALFYSLDGLIRKDRIQLDLFWHREVIAAQGYLYGRFMLAPICFYLLRFIQKTGLYIVLFKKLKGGSNNGYDRNRNGNNV